MVQQILLGRLMRQLGPAGRILRDVLRENEELRARVRELEAVVDARRTLKRRSPAEWHFRVLRWEWGQQTFQPRGESQPKTVRNLRIFIHPDDPHEGAPYWDVTSKRLQAVLEPILPRIAGTGTYVHVTRDGDGVGTQHSVRVCPAQAPR